jgi:hypothetical protein
METKDSLYNIPERFLRQIWKKLNFSTDNLVSTDNRPIEILSPGVQNQDSGPDFKEALIRIDGILYKGEVEIHCHNKEWFEHGHQNDPRYNSVILHVVLHLENKPKLPFTQSKRNVPILLLRKYLNLPYNLMWGKVIIDERAERLSHINCFSQNNPVDKSIIENWIQKLSIERVELKVRRFEERLKELVDELRLHIKEPPPKYGDIPFGLNPEELPPPTKEYSPSDFRKIQIWEQLLYEGFMEALGYSKNQESFLKLARNVRLKFFKDHVSTIDYENIESVLFGASGLLIKNTRAFDDESIEFLRLLKRLWKQHKENYHNEIMKETDWQFFRLRPDNFPTVRIAGAARIIYQIVQDSFFKTIIRTLKDSESDTQQKYFSILQKLIIPADRYWSSHFKFGESTKTIRTKLVGKERANEIILNALIPVALLYARIFKDKDIRKETLSLYKSITGSAGNSVTRIIDKQLIKGKLKLKNAFMQQGILQLYKFYCAEERCQECEIGKTIYK